MRNFQAWLVTLSMLFLMSVAHGEAGAVDAESQTNPDSVPEPKIVAAAVSTFHMRRSFIGEEAGMFCVDPDDSEHLIGIIEADPESENSGIVNPFHSTSIVKISRDGGRSWATTLVTNGSESDMDPACVFGSNGRVHVTTMSHFNGAKVWTSEDRGVTWQEPVLIESASIFDRPFLAVDRYSDKEGDVIYLVGADILSRLSHPEDEILIYRSMDHGKSFNQVGAMKLPETGAGKGTTHLGQVVVAADGTLVISWTEVYQGAQGWFCGPADRALCGTSRIVAARSTDGGKSFSSVEVVHHGKSDLRTETTRRIVGKFYPTLAIGPADGADQQLYIAWSGTDNGRQEIYFSRSKIGDSSWIPAILLNDDKPFVSHAPIEGPNNAMPVLAASPRGNLALMYYAQRAPVPHVGYEAVVVTSQDQGLSWSAPTKISAHSLEIDRQTPSINFGAPAAEVKFNAFEQNTILSFPSLAYSSNCNYGIVAAPDGSFILFPLVNPSGWISREVHREVPQETGVERRFSSSLTVEIVSYTLEQETNTLDAIVRIRNQSAETIPLPLRLMADTYRGSDVIYLNADNGRNIRGAWWDFALGSATTLEGGYTTDERLIRMRPVGSGGKATHFWSSPAASVTLRILRTAGN